MEKIKKVTFWRSIFLGTTFLAILTEIIYSFDNNPNTEPLTVLIGQYIPFQVTMFAIAGLSGWLVIHFLIQYGIIKR